MDGHLLYQLITPILMRYGIVDQQNLLKVYARILRVFILFNCCVIKLLF